jgi:hypothetical protein
MVRRKVSVPEGVERTRERWEIVASVFERYNGSQLWRVLREGIGFDGGVDMGSGIAFSGAVSGGGSP